jgi:hypothetical protein
MPTPEEMIDMFKATPALPCWVSGKPSQDVATAAAVPGELIRMAEMAPPYSAAAYREISVTIDTRGSRL